MVNNLSTSPFPPHRVGSGSCAWPVTAKNRCRSRPRIGTLQAPGEQIHALMYTFFSRYSYRSSRADSLNTNRESGLLMAFAKKRTTAQTLSLLLGGGVSAHPLTPAADTPLGSYCLWKHKLQPATAPKARNPSPCPLLPTSLDKHDWFLSDLAMVLLIAYWVTTPFVVQRETTVENTTKHPINNFWFFPLFLPMDNWF